VPGRLQEKGVVLQHISHDYSFMQYKLLREGYHQVRGNNCCHVRYYQPLLGFNEGWYYIHGRKSVHPMLHSHGCVLCDPCNRLQRSPKEKNDVLLKSCNRFNVLQHTLL
jgi:hypothetical protein